MKRQTATNERKFLTSKYVHIAFYAFLTSLFGLFYILLDDAHERFWFFPIIAITFLISLFVNKRLRQEVEEKKRTEIALEHSENLFKGIFNNAAVGIALLNQDGYYQHVNLTFSRMIGYSQEQLRAMKFHDITLEEDLPDSIRLCREIWEGTYTWRTGEKRYICKNGETLWTEINLSSIQNNLGEITDVIVVIVDITLRKRMEQELLHQATTDFLTGVDNRLAFMQKGHDEFSRAIRYGRDFALLLLDVDYFKSVNDMYGHLVGDRVLKDIVAACQGALRETDILARIGGEEFAVILLESDINTARTAALRIQQRVKEMIVEIGDIQVQVTVSIGISIINSKDKDLEDIFKRADDALYRAKNSGRNKIVFSDEI